MFTSYLLGTPDDTTLSQGGSELLDTWRRSDDAVIWVNIDGELSSDVQVLLTQTFGLHRLALQDASRDRHPPKFEAFGDHSFILYKGLSEGSTSVDHATIQISLFVGPRFLVTRHSGPSTSIRRAVGELQGGDIDLLRDPGLLAARISRWVVDRYLNVLLALEPRLEAIEECILTTGDDKMLGELIAYKSDLTQLRRLCRYHDEVASTMRTSPVPGMGGELEHEIVDVSEQWQRAASLADLYYQLSTDLIDGYISVSSHRLNQIMRVLTIVTTIFVPLGFLAGIYGMNFEYIPELKFHYGYFVLLSVMAIVVITLLATFRRKRWL